MMKLWITLRNLPSSTNCNRTILSNTLLPKHSHSIRQSKTYLSRRKLWMTPTNTPRKWSIAILRMYLSTHRPKYILWAVQLHTHLIH